VPHTTVRDWWRRFQARAPLLVAGLCSLVVELGGLVDGLPGVAERAVLAALGVLAAWVGRRLGGAAPAIWPLAAIVSGGGWLAATSPPWAGRGRAGLAAARARPPPASEVAVPATRPSGPDGPAEQVALFRYRVIAEPANPRPTPG